jgi:hypothetical protein
VPEAGGVRVGASKWSAAAVRTERWRPRRERVRELEARGWRREALAVRATRGRGVHAVSEGVLVVLPARGNRRACAGHVCAEWPDAKLAALE